MVGVQLEFPGHEFEQPCFNRGHILARRDAGTVGDAKDMRVDRDRGLTEGDVQDDVGRLAADAGQLLERFACRRDLAAVVFEQQLAGGQNVFCLGAEKPDALDVVFQSRGAEFEYPRRRVGHLVEFARREIDALVGSLRRQHDRDQQFERRAVHEFAARFGIGGAQPAEN